MFLIATCNEPQNLLRVKQGALFRDGRFDGIVFFDLPDRAAKEDMWSLYRNAYAIDRPDADGQWWADLAPVGGPRLGPFKTRTEALAAERAWLEQWLSNGGSMPQQILCWTDGHFFWHDGCVDVTESDCELRAVFEGDAVPADACCDTCGGLAAEPREVADDPGR